MRELLIQYGGIYLMVVNTLAYGAFALDKWKAKKHKWRIPENTLLGLSLAGGFLGAGLAMLTWHHKTRKRKFQIGVPLTAVLWIGLLCLVLM